MFFENFPFVYFLIIAGFLITLCLDQVLFKPTWRTVQFVTRAVDYEEDKQENPSQDLDSGHRNRLPIKSNSNQEMLPRNGAIHEGGQGELVVVRRVNADKTLELDKTNFNYEGGQIDTEQIDTERQL